MELVPTIGVEIHVQLKTKSKMFSKAPNTFGLDPNSQVMPLDMAFPGTMPVVNKEAVSFGIKLVTALNMKLSKVIEFDRKNYFYPDLTKGYQITQQFNPIGTDGYVELTLSDQRTVRVRVNNAHLEEDTAKEIHTGDMTFINYNRAGIPLIEIVSEPDMHSGEEAMKYVEAIREIVTYLGISDGKMEDGSMRCDINISLSEKGSGKLGTKAECKNLNTIMNIKSAVDYEIQRQTKIIENGGEVEQETRRYDEQKKQTVLMRKKTNAVDYKYFREPNIIPIDLQDDFIYDSIHSMNKLPKQYRIELKEAGLEEYEIVELLKDQDFVRYFEECLSLGTKNPKTLWNYLMVDTLGYLNKNGLTINEVRFTKDSFVSLMNMIDDGKLNSKQAKEVLSIMLEKGGKPQDIAKEKGMEQISDATSIKTLVDEVLQANPSVVEDWKHGKDHAIGYLVGQVMKKSKGKANPSMAKEMILSIIGPLGKRDR